MGLKPMCGNCKENVTYSIKVKRKRLRKGEKNVRYKGFYAVCDKCGGLVNVPEINKRNTENYKKAN